MDGGCDRPDCPGPDSYEVGYGLAGGGMGAYTYCPICYAIVDKWQEPDEDYVNPNNPKPDQGR